jgi:hypothetical protein
VEQICYYQWLAKRLHLARDRTKTHQI